MKGLKVFLKKQNGKLCPYLGVQYFPSKTNLFKVIWMEDLPAGRYLTKRTSGFDIIKEELNDAKKKKLLRELRKDYLKFVGYLNIGNSKIL